MGLVFYAVPSGGQPATGELPHSISDNPIKDFDLFENNEVLDLSLTFDVARYIKEKPKEEYLDAILNLYISKEDSITRNIRIRSCGEFRNKYCNFPPMVMNFKKTEFADESLHKIGKVKMFTHCRTGCEEFLQREYLVYRLYNVLTSYSFKVRPVRVTYYDTNHKKKPVGTCGFFIEPMDMLAERLNGIPIGSVPLTQRNIVPEMMDRMAIFSYMIGNTDWSVTNQHNCKILTSKDLNRPEQAMIIPYDFDYAGIVNTNYAIPGEGLDIESVRERIYIGICRSEEDFMIALQEFIEKKEEFYRVIQECDLISDKVRKDMIHYLDGFYNLFNDRNAILYQLLKDCRDI
jgi:hypothetical protein